LLNQAEAQLTRDAANAEYQQLAAERQSQLVDRGIVSKDDRATVPTVAPAPAGTHARGV
jgi:multidrug resistance efflux pump